MTDDNKNLRRYLEDFGNANRSNGKHLTEAELIRLCRETENETEETIKLRTHLADCDVCLVEFKNVSEFFTARAENEFEADKAELNQTWAEFLPKIKAGDRFGAGKIIEFQPRERQKSRIFAARLGWAIAAALLISTASSLFWAYRLFNEKKELVMLFNEEKQSADERLKSVEETGEKLKTEKEALKQQTALLSREKEELRQENEILKRLNQTAQKKPQADGYQTGMITAIFNVYPANPHLTGNEKTLTVPATAKNIVLIANDVSEKDFSIYRAELVNQNRTTVWRGENLRRNFLGNIPVIISRAGISAGNYRLILYGKTSADQIGTYPIKFEFNLSVEKSEEN